VPRALGFGVATATTVYLITPLRLLYLIQLWLRGRGT
jgi:hypothetical protein